MNTLDLYVSSFVLTLEREEADAIKTLCDQIDHEDQREAFAESIVSLLVYCLVVGTDYPMAINSCMDYWERLCIRYKQPYANDYAEFWAVFQALSYVFFRRHRLNYSLRDLISDVLPSDSRQWEEGIIQVKSSPSGRSFLIQR